MNHSNTALHDGLSGERGSSILDKWLLRQVFKGIGPAPIRFVLHETEGLPPPGVAPVATVWIRDRQTLMELALDPEVAFGEAYADGRIQLEGDLVRSLELVYQAMADARIDFNWYQRMTSKWMGRMQANTLRGSRDNIQRHYDLGNDFYKLWLDRELLYTCAYFPSPTVTLEEAQLAKMDYICRKLRLQPGETVVEAGCGWGSLALHMARRYGVRVKAFNISREQILYATRRAAESGMSDQVEFIEDDYRNIRGKFDVFVSIGMIEHVGQANYAGLGSVIHRAIGDSGRGLLHFIGRTQEGDFSRWIRKRIFPGAYAPTLRQVMDVLEPHNYSILDVENLRPHYAKTLEHWLSRFENSRDQVVAVYDSWFERAWRLYLAGSIAGFRTGTLQLFQITFAGCKSAPISWTRAPLYAQEGSPCAPMTS